MKKTILLISLIGISFFSLSAQKTHKVLVGFEFGNNLIKGELKENWFIRQDIGKYYGQTPLYRNINGNSTHQSFAVKPELALFNDRLTLFSGLRLHLLSIELGNATNRNSYFFLRYRQDANNIKFARVILLKETIGYLTIPVEARYFILQSSWLGLYIKGGAEGGVKLYSKNDIKFLNETFKPQRKEIWNSIAEKPNPFYAAIYGSIGVRAHLTPRVDVNLEIEAPNLLTPNNSSMINMGIVQAVKLSVQIPLEKRDVFNVLFK